MNATSRNGVSFPQHLIVRDGLHRVTDNGGYETVQALKQFNRECEPVAPRQQAHQPREIIGRVRGEVRFLAHYIGLADYRIGHRIRVLTFRGRPCDEIVQVRFERLRDLIVSGF